MKMGGLVPLALGILAGCNQQTPTTEDTRPPSFMGQHQVATPPSCGNVEFYSRRVTVDGEELYYEWCQLSQHSFNEQFHLFEPVEGQPGLYEWRLGNWTPIFIKEENGGYLRGDFIYHAHLQPAPPLVTNLNSEEVFITLGEARFSVDSDRISYIIHNQGKNEVMYGREYAIEFFDGGQWLSVPFIARIGFTQEGLILEPGSFAVHTFDLAINRTEVFDFQPGRYRIRKVGLDIVGEFELY
ncbi:MAG: hypothetical protein FWF59_14850 [Turicibacter sp.]|nr:hypothetical protein [Turicibacter sp.]